MSVSPRFLLLGLLVVLYLHSSVEGQHQNTPEKCCFSFYNRPIPVSDIILYEKTGFNCKYPGLILTTKKGEVCVDPFSKWVKQATDKISRVLSKILHEKNKSETHPNPTTGQNTPEKCCFSFYNRTIPVSEIIQYEITGFNCEYPGVIFTTTKNVSVCVDPDSKWVKRATDIISRGLSKILHEKNKSETHPNPTTGQ